MTDNQDFTVFLYHLVRYIILSNITMFTVNGMHQLRLSGTDFLPQAAQQPNFVFMRGINMNFLYFADHYVVDGIPGDDIEAAAKAFVINMADARSASPDMLAQTQVPNVQSMSVATGARGTTISDIILTGINFQYGISIDFVLPAPDVASGGPFDKLGSEHGIAVSNIVFGDSEELIAATFSQPGLSASTTKIFVAGETVGVAILPGMFVEVVGPSTHDTYLEKRRIVSTTPGVEGTITVATDFSGSLSGAVIQVIKRSTVTDVRSVDGHPITKKFTFDVTIDADTPTGVWDLKVTNPDLISSTLTNSFTIT